MFSKPNNKPDSNKSHSQDKQDKEVQAFFKTHSSTKSGGLANKFAGRNGGNRTEQQNPVEEDNQSATQKRLASLQSWMEQYSEPEVVNVETAESAPAESFEGASESFEGASEITGSPPEGQSAGMLFFGPVLNFQNGCNLSVWHLVLAQLKPTSRLDAATI